MFPRCRAYSIYRHAVRTALACGPACTFCRWPAHVELCLFVLVFVLALAPST